MTNAEFAPHMRRGKLAAVFVPLVCLFATGLTGVSFATTNPRSQNVSFAPKGTPPAAAFGPHGASASPGICGGGVCYYYVGASQSSFAAAGAAVSLQQAQPVVGVNDYHSLAELAVESPDGQQIVEVGWIVAREVNNDSVPHLFVYHWVDGLPTCYNGCGFVSADGPIRAGGRILAGGTAAFQIAFSRDRWNISYDGFDVGYFPGSLWGGTFAQTGLVQAFGEVAASEFGPPTSQMGNGLLGSSTGSARISRFELIGSSARSMLSSYVIADPRFYTSGSTNSHSLRFGGPGTT
jgi:hypothetical protein